VALFLRILFEFVIFAHVEGVASVRVTFGFISSVKLKDYAWTCWCLNLWKPTGVYSHSFIYLRSVDPYKVKGNLGYRTCHNIKYTIELNNKNNNNNVQYIL
jgi:hypothetical protein